MTVVYISIVIVDKDAYRLIGVNNRKTDDGLVFADALVVSLLVVVFVYYGSDMIF